MITGSKTASPMFRSVAALGRRRLERVMVRGEPPDVDALSGWEYRGMNTGLLVRLLGIQKFVKGFYRLPDGRAFGYNERVAQNGPRKMWVVRPDEARPARFGFYRVGPADAASRDNAYLNALLLDYSKGGNGRFNPLSGLRDYVVRVDRGSDELLLGKAFLALGPLRLPIGYFVLERHRLTAYRRQVEG